MSLCHHDSKILKEKCKDSIKTWLSYLQLSQIANGECERIQPTSSKPRHPQWSKRLERVACEFSGKHGGLSSKYSYETKAPPFFVEVVSKKNVVLFSKACCQWNGHTFWRSKINMRIPPSGLTLVKKVVQQQKGAEFVTWPGMSSQLSQLLQHGISV